MKSVAFAPAHISGFFEPFYHNHDLNKSGSRGAGINLSLGATSEVCCETAVSPSVQVMINDKLAEALVTKLCIQHLLGNTNLHVVVKTRLDLPESQGFGMSAAGALSAALALANILHLNTVDALKAAHHAEVQLCTGLGDVLASSFGGIEIRRKPGLPPWGMIEHIPGVYPVVVCVAGDSIETKSVLSDKKQVSKIASYGRYCTKKIVEKPTVESLFMLSNRFTQKSGLAQPKVLQAIQAAQTVGMASMCMLGNSVFAIGDTEPLQKILSVFGPVYVSSVDQQGAHLLQL